MTGKKTSFTRGKEFSHFDHLLGQPSPLPPEVPLNKQNVTYVVPKTEKLIKLKCIPHFWKKISLVMPE